MKVLFIVIAFFLTDCIVTRLYCTIQKRRFACRNHGQSKQIHDRVSDEKIPALKRIIRLPWHLFGGWVHYKVILLGRVPCHAVRKFFLKYIYLMKIAPKAVIYAGFEIRAPWNIVIGQGSIIGGESKLDGRNEIIIGQNVNFSTGVWIWTEQHDKDDKYFGSVGGKVEIKDRAWISCRTTILPDVFIGEAAVIAAGCVVTKDVQPYSIMGGIPAKKIGERNKYLDYNFTGTHMPFW